MLNLVTDAPATAAEHTGTTQPWTNAEIQGNILKAFNRRYATYLFLRFNNHGPSVRRRLKRLLNEFVTRASKQDELSEVFNKNGRREPVDGVGMFGLSARGYKRLGMPAHSPADPQGDSTPFDGGLREPEDQTRDYIWDHHQSGWEEPFATADLDAFLLLADDLSDRLQRSVQGARELIDGAAQIVAEEHGRRLEDRNGEQREPFGFLEGRLNRKDASPVLVPEGSAPSADAGYGTFALFLKIEQHLDRFHQLAHDLQTEVTKNNGSVTDQEVREHAVGITISGVPLVGTAEVSQDFTFDKVPESVCPFHAHARAMRNFADEEPFPMVRRGIGYGPVPGESQNGAAPEPTGLLFLSLQPSLWTPIMLLGRAQRRRDAVLGSEKDLNGTAQEWTFPGCPAHKFAWADVTTIKGGEYFFIPSMKFIDAL